jgi:hypothetical protein
MDLDIEKRDGSTITFTVDGLPDINIPLSVEGVYTPRQAGSVKNFIEPIDAEFEVIGISIEIRVNEPEQLDRFAYFPDLKAAGFWTKAIEMIEEGLK